MAARRKTAASAKATAPTALGLRLVDVPAGHWALLADGRECRAATTINGTPLVRFADDAPRTGPTPMPSDTPVRATRAPELVAADRSEVPDPLVTR